MSKAWAKGSDYNWRTHVRPQVFRRNQMEHGGRCELAIPDVCTVKPTQIHHTLGRAVTGDDPRYLIAVCMKCNTKVGDPTKHREPASTPLGHWL